METHPIDSTETDSFKQSRWRHVQRVGKLHDHIQGWVPGAGLKAGDVRAVNVGPFSQLLLGPAGLASQSADPIPEGPPVGTLLEGLAGLGHPPTL
jgi:hypothetical protein